MRICLVVTRFVWKNNFNWCILKATPFTNSSLKQYSYRNTFAPFFPLDVNKPYEVEHIETQFCEAEFAHIDDSKNIDILKGKVSSSHHFIDNLNFFYSTSKNKPANTVDAVALLHTDYAISGSKSAE